MRSLESAAAAAVSAAADFAFSRAVSSSTFTSLIAAPAAGRSASETTPSPFRSAVSSPFFPRKRTRTDSTAAGDAPASRSASANARLSASSRSLTSADAFR